MLDSLGGRKRKCAPYPELGLDTRGEGNMGLVPGVAGEVVLWWCEGYEPCRTEYLKVLLLILCYSYGDTPAP